MKFVQVIHKNGQEYRYFRRDGVPRIALPANVAMDSESFLKAYLAALGLSGDNNPKPVVAGTIGELIQSFKASAIFTAYSEGYQRLLSLHLEAIIAKAGDARARDLREDHISSDLAVLPVADANRRRKAWSALCAFGKSTGKLRHNPAENVKLGRKLPKSDGHEPWLPGDIDRFRAYHRLGTPARLAMEVLHWTGARISDGVLLGDRMVGPDGVLAYVQEKTDEPAYVPWTNPLPSFAEPYEAERAMMFRALAARQQRHFTFLATAYGKTRSEKAIGNLVSEAARAAGLVDKTAHGLRVTRAVALADGGASILQIMAWTGHLTSKEIERYTRRYARRNAVKRSVEPLRKAASVKPTSRKL